MKVLLMSPLPPPAGGIATWTKLFMESDLAKNNEVDLINISVTGDRINNLGKRSLKDEIKRTKRICRELKHNVDRKNYDIVHINTSCSRFGMVRDYICAKIIKRSHSKLVLHCHCDTKYMVNNNISKMLFKKLCNMSDKIFSLNSSSYKHIKEVSSKESTIIPNFFDGNILNKYSKIKINKDIKNIIYVGHIIPTKGCDDIIDVAKEMPNINFKMIGYVSDHIRVIPKTNNVKFIGEIPKEEVLTEMINSDLLLFPTHTEGFPNVILEAMACGLPIISTAVGAIPDMIEDKGGIIVGIKKKDEIIKGISLLQDRVLREDMSKWNKKKFKENYTIDVVINKIFSQYL